MHSNLFYSTPYNPAVAEHLIGLGYREFRESITDPQADRHLIINNIKNTVRICDTINLDESAQIIEMKFHATVTQTPNN